jgi:hypothetical protein
MPASDPQTAELRRRLRYDTPFWAGGVRVEPGREPIYPGPKDFHGCVKILNKQAKLVPCIAHPWQLEFDDAARAPARGRQADARDHPQGAQAGLLDVGRGEVPAATDADRVPAGDRRRAGHEDRRRDLRMAKLCHAHLPTLEELGMGFSIKPAIIGPVVLAERPQVHAVRGAGAKLRMRTAAPANRSSRSTRPGRRSRAVGTRRRCCISLRWRRWSGEQRDAKMLASSTRAV